MSKAKKGGKGKGGKPKADEKGSSDGPTIYELLREKPAEEIEPDLTQPVTDLLKENVEYEVLIDRLQNWGMRIEKDN